MDEMSSFEANLPSGQLKSITTAGAVNPSPSLGPASQKWGSGNTRSKSNRFSPISARLSEKQRREKVIKYRPESDTSHKSVPYSSQWRQRHSHYWTAPGRGSGNRERVTTPWHFSTGEGHERTSSTQPLNGWTPWSSWRRAQAELHPQHEGRTFEFVPVTSLNRYDDHTTSTSTAQVGYGPRPQSPSTPLEICGEEWVDSDRSFVSVNKLGPTVSQGLMHYPDGVS